eukprot:TRINITY_DN6603_c0_g4_i2.p1 TRINITY_DN6603_c0_g4~~TRINITY_DN6603_c0_g4_i2.p1  ORF type:complete len:211 (+),score=28.46 TRINITY_DN6603_c0_g4_i2:57-689(+)
MDRVALRRVPNDNDCLFSSILYLLNNQNYTTQQLRQLCADVILRDREIFTTDTLEMSHEDYAARILNPFEWGSEIETCILCDHFQCEFGIFNISTDACSLVVFGSSPSSTHRGYLLYTGSHYDALVVLSSDPNEEEGVENKMFNREENERVEQMLRDFVREARVELVAKQSQQQEARGRLRCAECQVYLADQEAAQVHYLETEHLDFEEV